MVDHHRLLSTFGVIALLSACSGGGSPSSDSTSTNVSSISSTEQTASGMITGFGSVFVNGVEWETDQATIEIDDAFGLESDLEVGHIVTVHGTVSSDGTASADSIEYDAELKGQITEIDLGAGTITVLGHVVLIDDDTIFDDSSLVTSIEQLAVGNFVEINGYPMGDGRLLAVRLELESDSGEVEVAGVIGNLDTSTSTFNLNDLVVDYTTAMLEDFDGTLITDGQHVEVEGNSTLGPNGELIAIRVELEHPEDFAIADEFELEGIITAVNGDGSIVVGGVTIAIGADVTVEHGNTSDLAVDVKVQAHGTVNASGDLIAADIEIQHHSSIEVAAPLQSVDATNGTLTVLGIDFHTMSTTQLEDDSALDVPFFGLSDLNMGDWVEVRAYTDEATGEHIATRVERDDAEDLVELEAPIDSVLGDQLLVLGVIVATTVDTQFEGLLSDLLGGMNIEVRGVQTGDSAMTALQIELDN